MPVAVALLLVLAGCTSGGDDGGVSTTTVVANDPGTATGGETTMADPSTTSEPNVVFDGGELDLVALAASHDAGLAESVTFTKVVQSDGLVEMPQQGTQEYTDTQTYTVDLGRNTAHWLLTGDHWGEEVAGEWYFSGAASYNRVNETSVETTRGLPTSVSSIEELGSSDEFSSMAGHVQFEEVGRELRDGVTVIRYEAPSLDSFDKAWLTQGLNPGIELTDASAVLLVGTDGVVRYFELRIVAITDENWTMTVTSSASWSDLGSTTVTEPDWAADVRTT
jgi:hypothetical protein